MKYMLLMLMFLLVACNPAVSEPESAAQPSQELSKPIETAVVPTLPPTLTPEPATSVPSESNPSNDKLVIPETLQSLVEKTVLDLSSYLEVNSADIEATAIEEVTWSDGSLGCPAPGMMYTMALVPGYKITLTVDGQTYDYHTRGTDGFVLCVKGQPVQHE